MNTNHRPAGRASRGDSVSLDSDARRLARAAQDLDTDLVARTVRKSVDEIGAILTWERLVQPVWQYLGSRSGDVGTGSAVEHMYVQSAMSALAAARRPRPASPTVLLACADEELQVFPLEALVVALEESGAACCVLGARVPPYALAAAAARLDPSVVVIWSQTRDTAAPGQIATAFEAAPAATVVAAGPGWSSVTLPPDAVRSTEWSTTLVLTLAVIEAQG